MEVVPQLSITDQTRIRACANCNRKKKRCNGEKPQCQLCFQSGAECTYPLFSLKPGPKKGSKRAHRRNDWARGTRNPPGAVLAVNDEAGGAAIRDGVNSMPEITILSPTTTSRSSTNQVSCTYNVSARHSENGLYFLQGPIQPLHSHEFAHSEDVLPPQEIINHLVDVYFNFVHPQIRLLHRPNFLHWASSGEFASKENSIFLLSAMFGLAAKYSDQPEVELFDRSLLSRLGTKKGQNTPGLTTRTRRERGQGFISQARELFQDGVHDLERLEFESGKQPRISLDFVQAAVLLSYAEVGLAISSRAYCLIATTVRLAYDCGLDQIDSPDNRRVFHLGSDLDKSGNGFVHKEELRRAWWAIADLENFICTVKVRPRMIDWDRCKTKLPCEDEDWFSGREIVSRFLPANLSDLRTSLDLPSQISVLAYRILATHLVAKFVPLVTNNSDPDSLSHVEECVAGWKLASPINTMLGLKADKAGGADDIMSDAIPLYLLIDSVCLIFGKIRSMDNITSSDICAFCQDISTYSRDGYSNRDIDKSRSPQSEAFEEAYRASDVICSIVRDWPTACIARTCPFIVGALWAPACIQLLIKSCPGAIPGLVEKASLSLRVLTMVIEQFAEFWGIGQYLLNGFRKYEQKLTNVDWIDEGNSEWNHFLVAEVITLPNHIDASFLRTQSSLCNQYSVLESFAGPKQGELESNLSCVSNSHAEATTDTFFLDVMGSADDLMEELSWIGLEGIDAHHTM